MTTRNGGGDRDQQFQAIYDRHYPRMFRFFRRYVGHEDAHDLAQGTFASIYEKFEQYRGDAEWGFLQRAAHNRMVNWWRDRSAAKRKGIMVPIDDPVATAALPVTPAVDHAERELRAIRMRRLEEAIRALSTGQQQVIRLQLDGLQYDEIATTLQISMDAVKSRRRDALKVLKARLKDAPGGVEWPDALREDEE